MPVTDSDYLSPTFGVEIEAYLPEGQSQQNAATAISTRLGAPVVVEHYNHGLRPHWKIVPDGSLSDYVRGIEVAAPKLSGEAGLVQTDKVCKAMSDFGCTVSKRCGLHVHVDARGQPLQFFKNLVRLYSVFEPVLDSVLPASRRKSSNVYCKSLTHCNLTNVDRATSVDGVFHAATGMRRCPERRFHKLNLDAHSRHGTVEFRQHSGTLDPNKVRQWVVLCLRIVAAAKQPCDQLGLAATNVVNSARPGSKAYAIGQMLLRPEGVTAREVCATMNWPSVSLPQQARMCGLQYTTQRTGREVRYFAVQAGQAASPQPVEISVDGLASFVKSTDAERDYFRQRAADLGGSVQWAA